MGRRGGYAAPAIEDTARRLKAAPRLRYLRKSRHISKNIGTGRRELPRFSYYQPPGIAAYGVVGRREYVPAQKKRRRIRRL
ncbi:hypothetical protein ASG81_09095 [Paenibacillus sp. Soil522]|nr:hypothetical protein ASG81_09095 [Paenibacillus sp. Soil522]